ncbi:MAG: acyltransferase [Anaerolineae bacterium]|nr:acyltransferase [Anaerolineae bacterium]
MIILYHYDLSVDEFSSRPDALLHLPAVLGQIGVSLFIILSGASLMYSYRSNFDVIDFYVRRFLAIFPLFYVTYAAMLMILLVLYRKWPFPNVHPAAIFLTIFGLDGFTGYLAPNFYLVGEWFLGFIIIMYAVFPLLRGIALRSMMTLLALSLAVYLFSFLLYTSGMSLSRFPGFRILEFVFGMKFMRDYSHERPSRLALVVASTAALALAIPAVVITSPLYTAPLGMVWFTWIVYVAPFLNWQPIHRAAGFLSRYAYGAFLSHHVLIGILISTIEEYIVTPLANVAVLATSMVGIFVAAILLTHITGVLVVRVGRRRAKTGQAVPSKI